MRALFVLLFLNSCGLWTGGLSGAKPVPEMDAEDETSVDSGPAAPYLPSHTMTTFDPSAPDLVGLTAIDTDSLTIAFGGATLPPPAGIVFTAEGSRAVLRVGALTASLGVRVVGARALIVVCSRIATIGARFGGAAILGSPGPGGAAPGSGPGAGPPGASGGGCNGGGAGGSFGDIGGAGGTTTCGPGPTSVAAFGSKRIDFFAGSGGGAGAGSCGGSGGAGGGAIQISSLVSVRVLASAAIHVGGGGGAGGCGNVSNAHGGGGGGSGGTIFLEAPVIDVAGAVTANGGGGGEGGLSMGLGSRNGLPGLDALVDITAAAGGAAMGTDRAGGAGGASSSAAQAGQSMTANATGGGGGAVGRIWLRTRSAPANTPSNRISPVPTIDTTL